MIIYKVCHVEGKEEASFPVNSFRVGAKQEVGAKLDGKTFPLYSSWDNALMTVG